MKTKHWLDLLWLLLLWLHPSTKRNGAHLECSFHAQSYMPQSSTLFTKLPRKCRWTIGSKNTYQVKQRSDLDSERRPPATQFWVFETPAWCPMLQKFHENPVPHIPTNSSATLFPSSCSPPPCANLSKLRPDSSTNNPGIAPVLKNNPKKPKQSVLLHCTPGPRSSSSSSSSPPPPPRLRCPLESYDFSIYLSRNDSQFRSTTCSTGSQILLNISRKVIECHMNFIDPNGTSKSSARCLGAAKGEVSTGIIDSEDDGSGSILWAHRTPPQVLRNLHRLVHEKCLFFPSNYVIG